jgi:hypothetical protein
MRDATFNVISCARYGVIVDMIISEASLFFAISLSPQFAHLAIFPSFFGHSFSYLLDLHLFYSDSSTKYMQWRSAISNFEVEEESKGESDSEGKSDFDPDSDDDP